jgi:hypothetical protein
MTVKIIPRALMYQSVIPYLAQKWYMKHVTFLIRLGHLYIPLSNPTLRYQSSYTWNGRIPCGNTPQKVVIHPKLGQGGGSRGKHALKHTQDWVTSHHLRTINELVVVVAMAMAPTIPQVKCHVFDLDRWPSM